MNPQNLQTPQALTLESLAQAYNELNNKFTSAETDISILRNALNSTQAGTSNSALTDALTNASSRVTTARVLFRAGSHTWIITLVKPQANSPYKLL